MDRNDSHRLLDLKAWAFGTGTTRQVVVASIEQLWPGLMKCVTGGMSFGFSRAQARLCVCVSMSLSVCLSLCPHPHRLLAACNPYVELLQYNVCLCVTMFSKMIFD